MQRLNASPNCAPVGVTRTRCQKCRRFARLLTGQTCCDRCVGALPLDFGRGER
jgi:hypothetical protein